jgi:TMEM175 potassium channel family protein
VANSEEASAINRIELFSDAVLAILITIMVLDLRVPPHALEQGFRDGVLIPLLPKLAAYALSFFRIGVNWILYHALLRSVHAATAGLIWHNLHVLFWISLIPLVTEFLGENPFSPIAVAGYGFVLFCSGCAWTLMRAYVARKAGSSRSPKARRSLILTRAVAAMLLNAAAVPLAFVSASVSLAIFVFVPTMLLVPQRQKR